MSETQIAALKFIQTNNDNASVTSFEKTHDVKEDSPKNKLISISSKCIYSIAIKLSKSFDFFV